MVSPGTALCVERPTAPVASVTITSITPTSSFKRLLQSSASSGWRAKSALRNTTRRKTTSEATLREGGPVTYAKPNHHDLGEYKGGGGGVEADLKYAPPRKFTTSVEKRSGGSDGTPTVNRMLTQIDEWLTEHPELKPALAAHDASVKAKNNNRKPTTSKPVVLARFRAAQAWVNNQVSPRTAPPAPEPTVSPADAASSASTDDPSMINAHQIQSPEAVPRRKPDDADPPEEGSRPKKARHDPRNESAAASATPSHSPTPLPDPPPAIRRSRRPRAPRGDGDDDHSEHSDAKKRRTTT
eukprot:m.273535 g.273535  ORF g.273535 m.273535 type:complete len:298 (+) comp16119_c0_seq6:500-1393(+)